MAISSSLRPSYYRVSAREHMRMLVHTGSPVGGVVLVIHNVEVTNVVDGSSRRTRRNLPSQDSAKAATLRGEMCWSRRFLGS